MSLAKTDNLSKIYRNPPLFAKEGLELKDTAIRPHENNIWRKQSQIWFVIGHSQPKKRRAK